MAVVLLQHAGTDTARRPDLSQREMAVMLGTSWDMVSSSLKSLQDESVIRIVWLIIKKEFVEKVARVAERIQDKEGKLAVST